MVEVLEHSVMEEWEDLEDRAIAACTGLKVLGRENA